ncbi:hypothetical protein BCR35DRAFT_299466 [Leucosporidium creatinivorum]|uniref:histidine kinase n=1 Tax=Leucosporidium creatinivorum TaxID=106004 RepID=A0A1Y2G1S1_9BASI|nr:hypothetical protein BCR35DRAFT_299466 [Leucosporidium creatinivorum]
MGEPTEAVVQRYLRQLEQGVSDPAAALAARSASAGASSSFSPTPGFYGRPGAQLPTAEESRAIFVKQGWIPAVAGPFEEDRRRVLERYNLGKTVEAHHAIDRVVDLASSVFKVPIVVISLVQEDQELFVSTLGWDKDERDEGFPRIAIPLDAALCPHRMVVLEDDTTQSSCLILPNASKDWRFKHNPYVRDGGPITFFASTNIYLPTVPGPGRGSANVPPLPSRLPVGSLCIVDRVERDNDSFGPEQQTVLKNMASMIGREFELARERRQREQAALQTAYLGELFRSQMIYLSRASAAKPDSQDLANGIAERLKSLLKADSSVIIDLRAFHAPLPSNAQVTELSPPFTPSPSENDRPSIRRQQSGNSGSRGSAEWYSSVGEKDKAGRASGGMGTVSVMGGAGWDWAKSLEGASAAISHFLITYYSDDNTEFDSSTVGSPLVDILPPQAQASLAVPIFDVSGEPSLLLVVCSNQRYFRFEEEDRGFVENVGAVIIGSLLRKRIIDADRAKLAFVSQISHELRTPLHGIGSQVELIRAVCPKPALKAIEPLLSVADVCVSSLREILDDTLEFSKMSNSVNDETSRPPAFTEVDLENLVEEVVKSCWSRGRQRASATGDVSRGEVSILLDVRLRHTQALVDVGGLKRVLFNVIGNSLKFTDHGSITITLYELNPLPGVGITVADTGRGMSETFLKEELFVPFRQADHFGSGAGLGVSISDAIVRRMNGTLHFASELGVGTTASISLPLALVTSVASRPKGEARVLSDELSALFHPLAIAEQTEDLDGLRKESSTPRPIDTSAEASAPSNGTSGDDDDVFRVLIADDNPIARRILATFLKTKNIPFSEAADGAQAFELFKAVKYDTVLVDVQMPVLDGLGASALMRQHEKEHGLERARIVAISGLSSELGSHASVLESGQIDMWLTKGGPTLKTLTTELVLWQKEFARRRSARANGDGSAALAH